MKRESNIELLRVVAMLMVVLLHCNYFSLGGVKVVDIQQFAGASFVKAYAEQLCIICVNVFVLISGWFGIRPCVKGVLSLLFQVYFFHILILLFVYFCGENISIRSIIKPFYFGSSYWFVVAYLILYSISPVLNAFVENASVRMYISVLVAFFFFEFAFGWVSNFAGAAFNEGYTAISFIGLYLLARFICRYSKRLVGLGVRKNFFLYLFFSIVPVILYFITLYDFNPIHYSSPFVILSSVFFFLAFNKMKISSKFINYLACSCFSIYLVHLHPLVYMHFQDLMRNAYDLLGGGLYILFAIIFAVIFGFCCIMVDKLRILLWKICCSSFLDKLLSKFSALIEKLYARIGI